MSPRPDMSHARVGPRVVMSGQLIVYRTVRRGAHCRAVRDLLAELQEDLLADNLGNKEAFRLLADHVLPLPSTPSESNATQELSFIFKSEVG